MKKFILILIFIIIGIIGLILILKPQNPNIVFKNDYESVNGIANSHGKINRTVTIPDDNVFITTTANSIVQKIENKETFYVYFGSKLCPWCRSTIEMACQTAKNHGISKIYYVDIWDDDGNEIVRDKYILDSNSEIVLEKKGLEEYKKLLTYFDALLADYTLNDENGNKISANEKRIYAPNYIYVENGVAKKIVTGISDKQKDSREELTKEILKDEEDIFDNFFSEVCTDSC